MEARRPCRDHSSAFRDSSETTGYMRNSGGRGEDSSDSRRYCSSSMRHPPVRQQQQKQQQPQEEATQRSQEQRMQQRLQEQPQEQRGGRIRPTEQQSHYRRRLVGSATPGELPPCADSLTSRTAGSPLALSSPPRRYNPSRQLSAVDQPARSRNHHRAIPVVLLLSLSLLHTLSLPASCGAIRAPGTLSAGAALNSSAEQRAGAAPNGSAAQPAPNGARTFANGSAAELFAAKKRLFAAKKSAVLKHRGATCDYGTGKWEKQAQIQPQMRYRPEHCALLRTVGAVNCLNPKKPRSSSYLRYKWVAPTCGASFGFNAKLFLEKMRNKVVASVGDSLSFENFMPALICQLNEVSKVKTADELMGKLAGNGLLVPTHIMRVPAYNITLLNIWSTFLNDYLHDEKTLRKYNGNVPPTAEDAVVDVTALDPTWAAHVGKYDVLLLQSAAHWRSKSTKWRRYFVDGQGVKKWSERKYTKAFYKGMKTAADFMTARKAKGASKPLTYFISAPATLDRCNKYPGVLGQSQVDSVTLKNRQAMVFLPAQLRAFRKSPVRVIQITGSTLYRPDALVGAAGNDDCVHWCLPGVPDSWTDMFYEQLKADLKWGS